MGFSDLNGVSGVGESAADTRAGTSKASRARATNERDRQTVVVEFY
jgi:hypothetical protein